MIFTSDLFEMIFKIIIYIIFLSPVLWLAGRVLAGKEKAKFSDAVAIIFVGTTIGAILDFFFMDFFEALYYYFLPGFLGFWLISSFIRLIIWLALVKHFFDCSWLRALAISILTVIFFFLIAILLAFLGLVLIALLR